MGSRGPAPRPTALTDMLGNPGHRPINHREPKPPRDMPEPPDFIIASALDEWRRVCDVLFSIGMLTQVDRTALAAYCQAYARWVECEEILSSEGLTTEGRFGISARPEVVMSQKYLGLIKTFCAEFGLTPSSRARMQLPSQVQEVEDEGLD